MAGRSAQITATCCDELTEDCIGGYPHTCNVGCAAVFLPFWTECRSALGKDSSAFEPAVVCEATTRPNGGSVARGAAQCAVQRRHGRGGLRAGVLGGLPRVPDAANLNPKLVELGASHDILLRHGADEVYVHVHLS